MPILSPRHIRWSLRRLLLFLLGEDIYGYIYHTPRHYGCCRHPLLITFYTLPHYIYNTLKLLPLFGYRLLIHTESIMNTSPAYQYYAWEYHITMPYSFLLAIVFAVTPQCHMPHISHCHLLLTTRRDNNVTLFIHILPRQVIITLTDNIIIIIYIMPGTCFHLPKNSLVCCHIIIVVSYMGII